MRGEAFDLTDQLFVLGRQTNLFVDLMNLIPALGDHDQAALRFWKKHNPKHQSTMFKADWVNG